MLILFLFLILLVGGELIWMQIRNTFSEDQPANPDTHLKL